MIAIIEVEESGGIFRIVNDTGKKMVGFHLQDE